MRLVQRIVLRLRALFRQSSVDREMDAEMRFHLEMQAARHERSGASPDEARRRALLEFGGVERFRERGRQERGVAGAADLQRDVAYALRGARRSPGFTAIVVLTLALGIGATTSIFSVVRDVLLRDLPFAEPERLVRAWVADPTREEAHGPLSIPDLADWRTGNVAFTDLAGYSTLPTGLTLTDEGEPVRLATAYVSESFFSTLGVQAAAGRVILPDEHQPGRERVIVLSYRLWQGRFGGDPALIGRTLRLNDAPFIVVGVLPADVRYPDSEIDLWTPLEVVPATGVPRVRGVRWIQVVGRLRPGVTVDRGREDLAAVAGRLANEFGDSNAGWTDATVVPLRDDLVGSARPRLLVLFGAVVLVLLLACTNIANLVLARGWHRRREVALRAALGANRGRLVRQALIENLVLALAGGLLGVALAWTGTGVLAAYAGEWLPRSGEVRPDGLVIAFGLLLSLLCGLGFGLAPALQRLHDIEPALRAGGRGAVGDGRAGSIRRILIGVEVAIAVILVAGAALLGRSFAQLSKVDLGFDADRIAFAKITIPASRYPTSATYMPAAAQMLERVRAIPGVASAAVVKDVPLLGFGEQMEFAIPARGEQPGGQEPVAQIIPVSREFFRTMGIPLLGGADLSSDISDSAAFEVVINEAAARRYWPDLNPVGEELQMGQASLTIAGVAEDVRYATVDTAPAPAIYVPTRLMTRRVLTFVVRARPGQDPAALVPAMRAAIRAVDRDQPFTRIGTMGEVVGEAVAAPRFLTMLVGAFGGLAMLLAAIGVYGVVSFLVGQRTNEIGVRLALGAQPRDVAAWALRTGMVPVLAGVAIGTASALAIARGLDSQLYQVSATDPLVFASVAGVLIAVSLLASAIPAIRAARFAPTVALRHD